MESDIAEKVAKVKKLYPYLVEDLNNFKNQQGEYKNKLQKMQDNPSDETRLQVDLPPIPFRGDIFGSKIAFVGLNVQAKKPLNFDLTKDGSIALDASPEQFIKLRLLNFQPRHHHEYFDKIIAFLKGYPGEFDSDWETLYNKVTTFEWIPYGSPHFGNIKRDHLGKHLQYLCDALKSFKTVIFAGAGFFEELKHVDIVASESKTVIFNKKNGQKNMSKSNYFREVIIPYDHGSINGIIISAFQRRKPFENERYGEAIGKLMKPKVMY